MSGEAIRIHKPHRRRQSGGFSVAAAPDAVFALMCPVREHEWEPGWKTNIILSETGLVEEGCIFTTPGGASLASDGDSADAIWVTPFYDRKARRLTMLKVTPEECVTRLDIAVDETKDGAAVTASYEHTALGPRGRAIVDGHTEDSYRALMDGWRRALSAHLR